MTEPHIINATRRLQALALDAQGFPDTAFIFNHWHDFPVAAIVTVIKNNGVFKGDMP